MKNTKKDRERKVTDLDKKIQVYGLYRSGTNFLEWTLKNNFFVKYDSTRSGISDVIGDERYKSYNSLKHCLPNTKYGKALIIQRDYEEWDKSVKKTFRETNFTREIYNFYYDTPYRENWNEEDFLFVNHRWAVLNYEELLKSISKKFHIEYKKDWEQPMYKMNWDGGKTMLNIPYKL